MYSKSKRTMKRILLTIAEHMPTPFSEVRVKLYKMAGVKISEGVRIEYGVQILGYPDNISLKQNVEIAQGVYFHARDKIVIGRNSSISPFVKIITNQNPNLPYNELKKYYKSFEKPVIIGDNTYVGTGAIILPGVTIHKMSVVAAGAVVTKNVPSYSVVAGIPAKVVKHLEKD